MGQVYLAEDLHNENCKVVIKQTKLEKGVEEQQQMAKIFFREADLLKRLNHRGIVKLTDSFWAQDEPEFMFLVMEYVPGQNLEKILAADGPLPSETVIKIAIQCCDVLEYLHSREVPIIYRDLKPSNLILRPDGLVVFVDFGIARDFEPKGPSTRVVTSGYAPPEQYFGKPEPRGDIYSLGATMHQLLTGVRPRPLTPCSPASILPAVLKDLDTLVRCMTCQELDDRPPSARAVQFELFHQYQLFHPEFEIPDLGLDEEPELPGRAIPAESPSKAGAIKLAGVNGALAVEHRNWHVQKTGKTKSAVGTDKVIAQTLFAKIKQWFNQWRT